MQIFNVQSKTNFVYCTNRTKTLMEKNYTSNSHVSVVLIVFCCNFLTFCNAISAAHLDFEATTVNDSVQDETCISV